ncbi:glucose-1-phosphate adenylyltransferase [Paenibacillus sp. DS2015]|uniref:glucose-1-phosphate adenylyltransferase n=1 Tax=Paenibacillus sp. DS2015 TaxID=3373917 RepID=UPI003D258D4E
MNKKDCIAMLLAGGEGRRLAPLTSVMAKPAVPFGGHYRIIDFPLSNCVNSGIDTIGVLTQYEAESLHRHIGEGEPWGYHTNHGVSLLPSDLTGSQYLGTADAIYKNIDYIDQQDPEHVLILSGDHIYHMDYSEMLEYHRSKEATATLSVMEVPWEEASRFGILNVDSELRVSDFVEKPTVPESNLASMGIYIFQWAYLKEILLKDAANPRSSHDFGKDIIPYMLTKSAPLFAYRFKGYWKDVGTVDSLWEAHMDLLDETVGLNLHKKEWPMYGRSWKTKFSTPKLKSGVASNCLISESCSLDGNAEKSIVFCGAEVGRNTSIKDSVIMPNAKIGRSVVIERAIIGEGAVIKDGSVIKGSVNEIVVIAPHETVYPKHILRTSRILQEVYEKSTRLVAEGLSS